MFLTNNSPDLCVLTLWIKFRQNNLYLASLPRISANLNENYTRYNFQALANISGNFRKIYNLVFNHVNDVIFIIVSCIAGLSA